MSRGRGSTRRPAVAGLFYPAAAGELAEQVDRLLAEAVDPAMTPIPGGTRLRALVVPHAGYAYSGPVAASGYRTLGAHTAQISRVVLLGPAHHVPLTGMAGAAAARWRTPLGEVAVERAPGIVADDDPHAPEHSLEVQLPFLQRLLPAHFTIVPIAVGRTRAADVADLLDLLQVHRPGLVVVSTDLSHYHDAVTATGLDRRTADAVLARDAAAIGPQDACGAWALRGLVEHARRHGWSMRLLDLRTSADTAGDPARVVGYGAFSVVDPT